MPVYAAFHLDLHCLPKYLLTGIQNEKGIHACTVILLGCMSYFMSETSSASIFYVRDQKWLM